MTHHQPGPAVDARREPRGRPLDHAYDVVSRRRALAALAVLGALLLSVHVLLTGGQGVAGPGRIVTPVPDTKVFVLVVDGMRPEDADDPHLTFLDDLRSEGFRAVVTPCLDALTIPCVTEAFSGTADPGLLGVYRNLLGKGGVAGSSLIADVVASGRTTALYHEGQYASFSASFTVKKRRPRGYPTADERAVAGRFIAAGHDLIVFHYPHLDNGSHHHRVGSKGYAALLDRLNADGQWIRDRLPPEYEFVVVGDHGHTTTGRHLFGLDVPTVFLSSARWFGRGTLPEAIPISTYRYLIGVPLGILPPLRYDGADLAERLAPGTAIAATAAESRYAAPQDTRRRRLGLLAVAAAAVAVAWGATPRPIRGWVAAGLAAATAFGLAYTDLIPLIHFGGKIGWLKWKIEALLLLAAALGTAATRSPRPAAGLAGFVAVALPGSVYHYGIFQHVPHLIAMVTVFVAVIPHARGWRAWSWIALGAGAWWLLFDANVNSFRIQQFAHPLLLPRPVSAGLWAAMAWAFAGGPIWRRALCGALAAAGYAFPAHDHALAGVTLAVVAAMVFDVRLLPATVAWANPTWYGASGGTAILACVTLAVAVSRLTPASARAWLPGVAAVGLAYAGLAVSTGLHTNRLDFDFAIAWLPGDLHLRLWPIVAAAMLVKAIVPIVLVVEGVRRWGDGAPIAGPACVAGLLRLASTALFVTGFLLATSEPPRSRLVELLEDIIAVGLVVGVIQASAWRWGESAPVATPPAGSQPTASPR